jgi:hypothetical protein
MLFKKVMIVCNGCDFGRSGIDGYYLGQGREKKPPPSSSSSTTTVQK